ncbi:hypothetical protein SUGI_0450650 [Cryptomeria japonica]|nr:hypothetical protein SUGI_0450650 [Cryptomeria japonica]
MAPYYSKGSGWVGTLVRNYPISGEGRGGLTVLKATKRRGVVYDLEAFSSLGRSKSMTYFGFTRFMGGSTLLGLDFIFILYTMFVRWRDVIHESTLEGHRTKVVQFGLSC